MSGITAQSASRSVLAGGTSPTNTASGFLTKEQISFGITGSPLSAVWSVSKPHNSGTYVNISNAISLNPVLTPDKEGVYVISCLVDGVTTYTLTLGVVESSVVSTISSIHFLPCFNVQITAPRSGYTLFYSIENDGLSVKLPDDSVKEIQFL